MYLVIQIRYNIYKQCRGNYIEVKIFNYMYETDIWWNSSQKKLGVMKVFLGVVCTNDTQMPCWLRL